MFHAPDRHLGVHAKTYTVLYCTCVSKKWTALKKEEMHQKYLDVYVKVKADSGPLSLSLQVQLHLKTSPILGGICLDKEDGRGKHS